MSKIRQYIHESHKTRTKDQSRDSCEGSTDV